MKELCYEHRAILDCDTNEVHFTHKGRVFKIQATNPKDPGYISINPITKDVLKAHPLLAIMVRDQLHHKPSGKTKNEHLESLLYEYQDVLQPSYRRVYPSLDSGL